MRISRRMALAGGKRKNSKITGPVRSGAMPYKLFSNDMYIGPPVGEYGILMYDQRGSNTGYAGSTALYSIDDNETVSYINTTSGGHDQAYVLSFGECKDSPEYMFLSGARDQSYHYNTYYASVDKSLTLSSGNSFPVGKVSDYSIGVGAGQLPSYIFLVMDRYVSSAWQNNLAAWNVSRTVTTILNYDTTTHNHYTIPGVGAVRLYNGTGKFINDSLTVTTFTPVHPVSGINDYYALHFSSFCHTKNKGIFYYRSGSGDTATYTWFSMDKSLTISFISTSVGANDGYSADTYPVTINFKDKVVITPRYKAAATDYNYFITIDDDGTLEILADSLDTDHINFVTRSAKKLYASPDYVASGGTLQVFS